MHERFGLASLRERPMSYDYREVAKEIDRLVRIGYVGQDLLSRLAIKYPRLGSADIHDALQEAKAMVQNRLDSMEPTIVEH